MNTTLTPEMEAHMMEYYQSTQQTPNETNIEAAASYALGKIIEFATRLTEDKQLKNELGEQTYWNARLKSIGVRA